MSDKELDKLFSKKLRNRQFDYNPKAWKAMEELLDNRNKAHAFYWRSAAVILLLGAVAASFALMQPSVSGHPKHEFVLPPVAVSPQAEENQQPAKETGGVPEAGNTRSSVNAPVVSSEQQLSAPVAKTGKPSLKKTVNERLFAAHLGAQEEKSDAVQSRIALHEESSDWEAPGYLGLAELPETPYLAMPFESAPNKRPKTKYHSPSRFYFNVGGSWSAVNFSAHQGYGWSAGLGYARNIGRGWSLAAEVNVVQRHSPGISQQRDSTFYSFNEERVIHTREVASLTHLELPLLLQYNTGTRHQWGIGGYAALLLDYEVQTVKERHVFEELVSKFNVQQPSEPEFLNRYDFGLLGQYRYRLSPSVNLGTRISGSLSDISTTDKRHMALTDVRMFLQYAF